MFRERADEKTGRLNFIMSGAHQRIGWNCHARKKGFAATADAKPEDGGKKPGIFVATIASAQIMKNKNSINRLVYEWTDDGSRTSRWKAHAYYDYCSRRRLMVVWPLNYAVIFVKWFQWKWDKARSRVSWIDRHVEKSVNAILGERRIKK